MDQTLNTADPLAVIAAARLWFGTPYLHQASTQGAGADCLGLARGIWRALHGAEPFVIPPYTRDWGEAGGRETLAEAAAMFLIDVPLAEAGPGCLVLFRMAPRAPAKHCGILSTRDGAPTFIHAYEGAGVVEHDLTPFWARKIRRAFAYPAAHCSEV